MSMYFFWLINIFSFLDEQWTNTQSNSYQFLINQTIFITKMLLGAGNQMKNLPLKTNPSSMSLMPKCHPLARIGGSGWREATLQTNSNDCIAQFHWRTPAGTNSLPDFCCCGMAVFSSCVRVVLLHCVPQSSEASAEMKHVAGSTSLSQPLTRQQRWKS